MVVVEVGVEGVVGAVVVVGVKVMGMGGVEVEVGVGVGVEVVVEVEVGVVVGGVEMKDGKQATFRTVIEYQIDPTVINAVASAPDPEAAARAVRILIGAGLQSGSMGAGAVGGSMVESQPAEPPSRPQGPQIASDPVSRHPVPPMEGGGFGFAEPPRTTLEAANDLGRRITADVGEILERSFH